MRGLSLLWGQVDFAFCLDKYILSSSFPYYLTLVKYYMTQERVHRANSYPPELVFLRFREMASFKVHLLLVKFEGQF